LQLLVYWRLPTRAKQILTLKGGPHCITWTHAEEVNAQLLSFLGEKAGKSHMEAA
jgi:pimeloyl-ACP methyl ester carboxylesterase